MKNNIPTLSVRQCRPIYARIVLTASIGTKHAPDVLLPAGDKCPDDKSPTSDFRKAARARAASSAEGLSRRRRVSRLPIALAFETMSSCEKVDARATWP